MDGDDPAILRSGRLLGHHHRIWLVVLVILPGALEPELVRDGAEVHVTVQRIQRVKFLHKVHGDDLALGLRNWCGFLDFFGGFGSSFFAPLFLLCSLWRGGWSSCRATRDHDQGEYPDQQPENPFWLLARHSFFSCV